MSTFQNTLSPYEAFKDLFFLGGGVGLNIPLSFLSLLLPKGCQSLGDLSVLALSSNYPTFPFLKQSYGGHR